MRSVLKIILLHIILLTITTNSFAQKTQTNYILTADSASWKLHVYDSSTKKLVRSLSYDDYKLTKSTTLNAKYFYFVDKNDFLYRLVLDTGDIESLSLKISDSFSISNDDKYICYGRDAPNLTNDFTNIATRVPVMYNLQNRSEILIREFSEAFLLDSKGISLDILYNKEKNQFDINYYWNDKIAIFEGFISTDTFIFSRTR
ncbi:MAG: hypothetical protein ACRC5H_02965 [Treponemataceae bacterium]